MNEYPRFEYLNVGSRWPDFRLDNVELGADGSLSLASVPHIVGPLGAPAAASSAPGPSPDVLSSGIAVAGGGDCAVFATDPHGHQIWRIDGCNGEACRILARGPGADIGQIDRPRGLATGLGPTGWRLYIADSGNHRVQVLDVATQQILAIWSGPGPFEPVDVAATRAGGVYVVDAASATVQRFRPDGALDTAFWQTLAARPDRPAAPLRVAVLGTRDTEQVVILDGNRLLFADASGAGIGPGACALDLPSPCIALACTPDAIYVGCADGTLARLSLVGEVRSITNTGPGLTALATGCTADQLLITSGAPLLTVLQTTGGFLTSGSLRGGPFTIRARPFEWQRLRVDGDQAAQANHLQLFTYVSMDATPPPTGSFDPAVWTPMPTDELDVILLGPRVRQALIAGPPADPLADQDPGGLGDVHIWIGATLSGNGSSSPVLRQMRLDWAPPAYLDHLPAIYREGVQRPLLLGLVLSLLSSELDHVDAVLDRISGLFDVAAAPADWLPWLAGWLDFTPASSWSTADLRARLLQAFDLYPWRGTAEGLQRYIEMFAGVHARIEEPATTVALFRLDEHSALGFDTMLAPEHEQGAVLASTAVLDQSSVLDAEDVGAPLFSDIVHRFAVQVFGHELHDPATLDAVERIVDTEKPAHTVAHVCVIEAAMRVGFQARLGIDTIVAGAPPDMRLGAVGELGIDAIVANTPKRSNRLGRGARVGTTL
ncbi:MAG TPA: phage tail protein [Chloroflexota bacterium]